jgi:anti-anti-sigma factor
VDQTSLELRHEDDRAVVVVTGALDIATAAELVSLAAAAVAEPQVTRLDVDLAMVTFVDSTGLAALVKINNAASAAGKALVLVKPRRQARQVIRLTQLDSVFTLEPVADDMPETHA